VLQGSSLLAERTVKGAESVVQSRPGRARQHRRLVARRVTFVLKRPPDRAYESR
jgi:hypothetical protein